MVEETQSQLSTTTQTQNQTQAGGGHRHGGVLKSLAPILKEAQMENAAVNSLLERVEAIYQTSDSKVFAEVMIRIMIVPFVDNKNEHANRLAAFFQKVVTKIGRTSTAANETTTAYSNDTESNSTDETNFTLSAHMIRLCAKYVLDQRSAVRSRLVETLALLLKSIPSLPENWGKMGKSIQEKLPIILLNRLQDKVASVRAHSARALCYLQNCEHSMHSEDEENVKDRITNELMHHLKWDPAIEVRIAIAKYGTFDLDHYEFLIEKVNDLSEEVRKTALKTIAEQLKIDELKIENRERILQSSLTDNSVGVKKMGQLVLREWIKACDNNVITLLTKLDVAYNKRTAELALKTLFQNPTPELFETVDRSIFINKVIPLEQLIPENAFYWRFIVEAFAEYPTIFASLVPDISTMCVYLKEFQQVFGNEANEQKAHKILPQLLKIILKTPMEEGGRVVFLETLMEMFTFRNLSPLGVKLMLKLFYQHYQGDLEHTLVQTLERMIRSKNFITEEEPPPPVLEIQETSAPPAPKLPEIDVKALRLEIGGLIHTRHKKEKEKTLAAEAENYRRAQELQDEINAMLEEIQKLKDKLERATSGAPAEPPPPPEGIIVPTDTDTDGNEGPSGAPLGLSLALSALITHLRKWQSISSHVRAFYEAYVTTAIVNESPYIRKQVLTAMTLMGLITQADAGDAADICVQGLIFDDEPVKVRAVECLVDLLQHYGFDEFKNNQAIRGKIVNFLAPSNNSVNSENGDEEPPHLKNLLMHFLTYKDGMEVVKAVVTGMIKLLLANRLSASRIVSTLFCIWINPLNDSGTVGHQISTWLPMFVKMGSEQAVAVADALVPTVRRIKTLPKQTYLSHAPVDRLFSFVITNTDQKRLHGFVQNPEKIHGKIAVHILNEMKSMETGALYTVYAKTLKSLNLVGCEERAIQSLKKKTLRLIQTTNKKTLPSLKAFHKYLMQLYDTEVSIGHSSESSEGGAADESITRMDMETSHQYQNVEAFSSSGDEALANGHWSEEGEDEEEEDEMESQEIMGATPEHD